MDLASALNPESAPGKSVFEFCKASIEFWHFRLNYDKQEENQRNLQKQLEKVLRGEYIDLPIRKRDTMLL